MYDIEREEQILQILKEKKTIGVNSLAKLVFCSGATIRRDLTRLEKKGLVTRTFGAVSILSSSISNEEAIFSVRQNVNSAEKKLIAKAISEELKSNQTLFIDSSTTMLFIVPYLSEFKNLLIITNGLRIAEEIVSKTNHRVYVIGGELMPHSNSMLGSSTIREISNFHADLALMSCAGASVKFGVSEVTSESAQIKAVMIKNSDRSIVAFDSSKINSDKAFKTASINQIDTIIISKDINKKIKKDFAEQANKLIEY